MFSWHPCQAPLTPVYIGCLSSIDSIDTRVLPLSSKVQHVLCWLRGTPMRWPSMGEMHAYGRDTPMRWPMGEIHAYGRDTSMRWPMGDARLYGMPVYGIYRVPCEMHAYEGDTQSHSYE